MARGYSLVPMLQQPIPALINLDKNCLEVKASGKIIFLRRWSGPNRALCIMNFNNANVEFEMEFKEKNWKKALDSSESCWYGPGSLLPESIKNREKLRIRAFSLALYGNQDEEVYD